MTLGGNAISENMFKVVETESVEEIKRTPRSFICSSLTFNICNEIRHAAEKKTIIGFFFNKKSLISSSSLNVSFCLCLMSLSLQIHTHAHTHTHTPLKQCEDLSPFNLHHLLSDSVMFNRCRQQTYEMERVCVCVCVFASLALQMPRDTAAIHRL